MVRIVLRRNRLEIALEQVVGVALALQKLTVVLDIVDAGENLLEVAQAELLLLEVEDQGQVFFSCQRLLSLEERAEQFSKVGLRRQIVQYAFLFALLSVKAEKPLF